MTHISGANFVELNDEHGFYLGPQEQLWVAFEKYFLLNHSKVLISGAYKSRDDLNELEEAQGVLSVDETFHDALKNHFVALKSVEFIAHVESSKHLLLVELLKRSVQTLNKLVCLEYIR